MSDQNEPEGPSVFQAANPFEGLDPNEAQRLAKEIAELAHWRRSEILDQRGKQAEADAGIRRLKEEQDRQKVLKPGAASLDEIQAAQKRLAELRRQPQYLTEVQNEAGAIRKWLNSQFREYYGNGLSGKEKP